jgi:glycosyltransferase involved in cell wall biosynthesis
MKICFLTDPLVTTVGAVRPALLLARAFYERGHDVTLITPRFNDPTEKELRAENLPLKAVGPRFSIITSFPTLDAWARCLLRNTVVREICDSDVIINTSSCILAQAHIYYAQGLMTRTLDEIASEMPLHFKYAYHLLSQPLRTLERRFIGRIRHVSDFFIANSEFCASMYRRWNIKVDEIINPPLDCSFFKPTTSKSTEDYVLTHFGTYGKEGKFPIIKAIADAKVTIKAFGNVSSVPKYLTKHPNISFLGTVTEKELVHLYSNALYTLFAFRHEPFGYVPIESMACATPVLTYNLEGPFETVVNGKTGWLMNSDHELFTHAIKLWKNGYDPGIRHSCRKRALEFDVKTISTKWETMLTTF